MTHDERTQLLKELDHARIYFDQEYSHYQLVIETDLLIQKNQKELEYCQKNRIIPTVALFPIFLLSLPVILLLVHVIELLIQFPGSGYFYIGLFGISSVAFLILLFALNRKLSKLKVIKLEAKDRAFSEQQIKTVSILEAYYLAYENVGLMPFKYTYPGMIIILREYIKDHRANCISDAINLYLDDAHKQRMEESQRKIARAVADNGEAIHSAKNWAAAGAVVSILGLLRK